MKQQKGFSLIEVLVSLILVSIAVLGLSESQLKVRNLLSQSVLNANEHLSLDRIDEIQNPLLSSKFSGHTLIEVLISLTMASVLMLVLTQVYLINKKHYLNAEGILSNQFDVLWVSSLLSDSIRRAGFTPCLGVDRLIAVDRRYKDKSLQGLLLNQQSVQVHRMSEHFSELLQVRGTTELVISNAQDFYPGRTVLISDCEHAEVHTVAYIKKLRGEYSVTLIEPLLYDYSPGAYMGEWVEEKWYLKTKANGKNALYYLSLRPEELTPLIQSLQVKELKLKGNRWVDVVLAGEGYQPVHLLVGVRV